MVSNLQFLSGFVQQAHSHLKLLIEQKVLLASAEMEEKLGVSREELGKAASANRIFAVTTPSGDLYYPSFFADPRYECGALQEVCKALGDIPAGSKLHFFMTPKFSLGNKSPLDMLVVGRANNVIRTAQGFAQR